MTKKSFGVLRILLVLVVSSGIAVVSGCTSSSPTVSSTTTIPSSTQPSNTFGSLSQTGQGLYVSNCSQCHGTSGQGISSLGTPALWGPTAQLGKYNTAQGLLNYITSTKPPGAPGTLPHETYVDVLCYLLIQNNAVSGSSLFNENQLNAVALK